MIIKHLFIGSLMALLIFPTGAIWAHPSFDVGFSPEGTAQERVIHLLDDSKTSIRLMGYSFTSPDVVQSLLAAKQRGVDVKVVVDEKVNRSKKASKVAMTLLVNAGIPLRTNGCYPILHDKVIISDGENVQVGSFNFTRRARVNSENVLIVRDAPALAKIYLMHWQSRWEEGSDWISSN